MLKKILGGRGMEYLIEPRCKVVKAVKYVRKYEQNTEIS